MKEFGSTNELPISSQLCRLAHTTPLVFLLLQLVFDQTASPFSNFACTHKPSSLLLLKEKSIHFSRNNECSKTEYFFIQTDLQMRLVSYFGYLSAHLEFPPKV